MKTQLIKSAKRFSILLLLITFINGCTDEDSLLPQIVSGFTFTLNPDTGTVAFINISSKGSSYEWDFGDGTTSTEVNPVHTYATGDYTIKLTASNSAGASMIFESEISISIPEAITFPIAFDNPNVGFAATVFGGATFEIVDNPDLGGTNTVASLVAAITNSGAAFEGIYFDLGTQIDLATNKTIKLNFWSNAPINVLIKLEEGTGAATEVSVSHGGTGWEEIYFTFTSSDKFSRITIFVDGPGTTAGTFYLDDLIQIATSDIPCTTTTLGLPIDFECAGTDYASKDSGDVDFEVVDNPQLSGINATLSKVGKLVFDANQQWENMNLTLDTPIDFNTDNAVKMKFYASEARAIKLKFEGAGATATEVDVNHTGSGWEELTFIFTSTDSFTNLILFVDGGSDTTGTFYVDDIEKTSGTPPPPPCTTTTLDLPIDFDCAGIDYDAKRTDGGIGFSVVDNPQLNGANAAASKVGQIVNAGANWENLNFNLDTPLDLSTNKTIKLKLYSTVAVPIKLKLETGGTPVEVDVNHTGAGWEELTFDFTSSDSFSNLIVFIDGPGNTAGTFYIDDIEQVAGTPPPPACTTTTLETPIDFDCAGIDYDAKRTDGGIGFSIIDNPQVNGANAVASKVGQIVNAGANWENLNFNLDTPLDLSTNKTIKLKLYSTVAVPIKLKLETGGTPVEVDVNHTGAGWEELTFDFTSSDSFSNLIVFIDGPGNTAGTFYIDDIIQVASGGGTSCPAPPAGQLLPNGDFEVDACWQFNLNGGVSERSSEDVNGGTFSAKLVTGANQAPNIKVERFAPSIAAGTTVQVTFKYKFTTPLGVGSILQVLAFSEKTSGADEHNLGNATDAPLNTWNTFTGTFVTSGNIAEGLSLLLQLTGSGNAGGAGQVYIDDVQVTQM